MSNAKDIVLEAKDITKHFVTTDKKTLTANNNVSLKLYKGKTLGIVGESGCGKSTLAKMLVFLDRPTSGEIIYRGQDISKLKGEELRQIRKNIQMVFQDPSTSLPPKMKVRDIICEPLLNFKMIKKSEKDSVSKRLLKMVELPEEFADRYPHNMSGGQRQRIAIARAIALEPEIIIMDEATSALDVSVQKNIVDLIANLQKEKNISIAFICHDISLMQNIADQVMVMYLGNVVEVLPGEKLNKSACHPYTKTLIDSSFDINMDFNKKILKIEKEAPSPTDKLKGCPFSNRCEKCEGLCLEKMPEMKKVSDNHYVACHKILGERDAEE